MPFIDYITLMLINMVAGLVMLSSYMAVGWRSPQSRSWAAGLGAAGLVALATGLHMTLTWPITPKAAHFANIAFGEMSVLFGAALLAAAVSVALRWSLVPAALYGALAGLASIVVGRRGGDPDAGGADAAAPSGGAVDRRHRAAGLGAAVDAGGAGRVLVAPGDGQEGGRVEASTLSRTLSMRVQCVPCQ